MAHHCKSVAIQRNIIGLFFYLFSPNDRRIGEESGHLFLLPSAKPCRIFTIISSFFFFRISFSQDCFGFCRRRSYSTGSPQGRCGFHRVFKGFYRVLLSSTGLHRVHYFRNFAGPMTVWSPAECKVLSLRWRNILHRIVFAHCR